MIDSQTDRLTDIQIYKQADRQMYLLLELTDLKTLSMDEMSSNLSLICLKMYVASDCFKYLTSRKRTIAYSLRHFFLCEYDKISIIMGGRGYA